MATILCPLPDRDFDPTETAVPWKLLVEAGHRVVFATERGDMKPTCDPLMLTGVIFGQLGAEPEPKKFYEEMAASEEIAKPVPWTGLASSLGGAAPESPGEPRAAPLRSSALDAFDALLLPGGHAPGMRQYLGSEDLQRVIAAFWATGKPVAAICHGVLPLARADVLRGKKTTCLPKYMERTAYMLTAWKVGRYYRTYDAYVEDEVRAALASPDDFVRGPRVPSRFSWSAGFAAMARGTREDDSPAMVVEDGAYVSARWPGDAYLFAKKFAERL